AVSRSSRRHGARQRRPPDGHSRSHGFGNYRRVAGGICAGCKGEARMADGETAATAYTIGWEPQPGPQTALLACPVFEVFFGGARGGGKTDGMLGEWASHADLHGKNAVGLMVRRQRVQLLETIERSRQIYGPIGARYNDQDKMWRWPNGARLRFAYLERDADADAYQGHSYTRVYVEELGPSPSASPVLRLKQRCALARVFAAGFEPQATRAGPDTNGSRRATSTPILRAGKSASSHMRIRGRARRSSRIASSFRASCETTNPVFAVWLSHCANK